MRYLLLALAATAPALAAEPPTHNLRVVNDTSAAVNQLFVTGGKSGLKAKVGGIFGGGNDDRDRLDAKMLPRSGSIVVILKGERCRYDLRAVLEDGRTYLTEDFDTCAAASWSISTGRLR
ncbi:MAG: hypothetical protein V4659_07410 [Pseudomonadota bacterium]